MDLLRFTDVRMRYSWSKQDGKMTRDGKKDTNGNRRSDGKRRLDEGGRLTMQTGSKWNI